MEALESMGEEIVPLGLRPRLMGQNSFGTMSLRRILGHPWHDYDLVLREAGLRQVTCIVRERRLLFYGHVERHPSEDPDNRVLYCRDPSGWTLPRDGHTHHVCIRWCPFLGIWARRCRRQPGRWPDGGR